jgi:PleD family two-component response regulator
VVANEIRDAFRERPIDFGGRKIGVTVSIGIHSRVPEVVEGAADLIIEASKRALDVAKNRGRDRVEVSD